MLYNDYIERLVGLKDIIVKDVKNNFDEVNIQVENKVKAHQSPNCKENTTRIHDYRMQKIKDISIQGKKTYIHLRKRRYVCKHCNKKFYEEISFLPKYHRMTSRLVQYIISQLHSTHSMTSVANQCNVSVFTVGRVFRYINYTNTYLPQVLSIDEFKGNAGEGKYQCILTDPKNKRVLDILKGREQHVLSDYFKKFKDRKQVQYFVMDMWKPYKDIAETYFKNATIVIDKYHFIRQIIWAFERVRKDEQKKYASTRRKYFKRSRKLLLKRMKSLNEEDKSAVEIMLQTSTKLKNAYLLKEKFYEFIDSKDLEEARHKLKAWYLYVGTCQVAEFNSCAKTISNWEKYILNSFTCPYTNGYTEGVNNKIKVLKRNAYGVRNFDRFRNRILHIMN